jgi:hypothetical protein
LSRTQHMAAFFTRTSDGSSGALEATTRRSRRRPP